MAKNCIKCNRKVGFFERLYEARYCSECYAKIEEERIAEREEEQRKIKIQEEQERKEKLQKQLAIKLKEEKIKKEKIENARDYLLYTSFYYVLISKIDRIPFHYEDIFKTSILNNKFDIIKLLLDEIIIQLPEDFNLKDIKEITTYRKSSKIIDKVLRYYVNRTLNNERYCKEILDGEKYAPNPNRNVLDDIEERSFLLDNGYLINFESIVQYYIESRSDVITALQKNIDDFIEKSKNINKYDHTKCIEFANESKLKQTYTIIEIYYSYAMMIIYYIYYNKIVDKIINDSELYDIYKKLKAEVHNDNYIVEKLFPIYNSLYKNEFDIIYEDENEFEFLIDVIENREKVIEKEDFIDINNSILNIDIKKYINNSDENDIVVKVLDEIHTNVLSYRKFLSISDILDIYIYSKSYIEILNNIKKEQSIIERDRILNGNMTQEKEFSQDSLDYSTITNGYEFEEYIANLYKLLGYKIINLTSKSGDQGADIVIEKDNLKYAVQVKLYNNPVGNKAIQEVVAAKSYYKTDKAMVVTNSVYTKQAEELAKANDVILVDGNKIEILKKEIES